MNCIVSWIIFHAGFLFQSESNSIITQVAFDFVIHGVKRRNYAYISEIPGGRFKFYRFKTLFKIFRNIITKITIASDTPALYRHLWQHVQWCVIVVSIANGYFFGMSMIYSDIYVPSFWIISSITTGYFP